MSTPSLNLYKSIIHPETKETIMTNSVSGKLLINKFKNNLLKMQELEKSREINNRKSKLYLKGKELNNTVNSQSRQKTIVHIGGEPITATAIATAATTALATVAGVSAKLVNKAAVILNEKKSLTQLWNYTDDELDKWSKLTEQRASLVKDLRDELWYRKNERKTMIY